MSTEREVQSTEPRSTVPGWDAAVEAGAEALAVDFYAPSVEPYRVDARIALAAALPLVLDALEAEILALKTPYPNPASTHYATRENALNKAARVVATYRKAIQ